MNSLWTEGVRGGCWIPTGMIVSDCISVHGFCLSAARSIIAVCFEAICATGRFLCELADYSICPHEAAPSGGATEQHQTQLSEEDCA